MNRLAAVLAALVFLAVPLPGAQAQATALLDDRVGDLEGSAQGQAFTPPSGRFTAADLRDLTVEETKEEFVFRLGVADLGADPEVTFVESTEYAIDFVNGKKAYRIAVFRAVFDEPRYFASLEGYDAGRDEYFTLAQADVSADPDEDVLTIEVARGDLPDQNGALPFPGQPFTGFLVTSHSQDFAFDFGPAGNVEPPVVRDSMPDDGPSDVALEILYGVQQSGHVRLSARIPYRSSNGEATTFVYAVEAENLHPGDQRYDLAVSGAPAGWDVRLPADSLRIEANGTIRFPVVAIIPFGHNHGSVENFVVTMTSRDDADSVGRVELGVRYVDPPQPAGHHDMVYLHSSDLATDELTTAFCAFSDCVRAYFNTLPEDDLDAGVDVPGRNFGSELDEARTTYYWEVPLSPGLELGLDFDLQAEGLATLPFHVVFPVIDGTLEGQLVHYEAPEEFQGLPGFIRDDRTIVARLETVDALDIAANADYQYEGVVQATKAGDYVPFRLGAGLSLEIYLNTTAVQTFMPFGPSATNPTLLTGGEMRLPLLEYHDPVNLTFSSLGSLDIVADSEQERQVNPDETVLFNFTVVNTGLVDDGLRMNVTGEQKAWARIVGDANFMLEAGEERRLVVAVTAPDGAAEGDMADLVLNVVSGSDPNIRALSRMVATVNTTLELADEAYLLEGLEGELTSHKGSPGPGVLALLAAIAVALVARRRMA